MKANELRIGNLLQGDPIQNVNQGIYSDGVFAITGYGISEMELGRLQKAEPIPLTEEWLRKFGFEVRESSTAKEFYIGKNAITHDWLFSVVWLDEPELIKAPNAPFYKNGRHTLYYVHQLQNLYFALTGEELTIIP